MDPEIFHAKFIAAIKNKDNTNFTILLPKIATRNEKFSKKYFYTACCFGTYFMVNALMRYIPKNGVDLYDTLYDAMNYNNTETVAFLVEHIDVERSIDAMVATHITLERNFNIENIKIVAQKMSVASLTNMMWKLAQNSNNLENRLEQVWPLIDHKHFFSVCTRERIEQLDNAEHWSFFVQEHEAYTARLQHKNIRAQISDAEPLNRTLRKM